MTHPLRLRAVDARDLEILSACLQDALVLIDDMAYLPAERQFLLAANRFRWEDGERGEGHARTATGVTFEGVEAVRRRNLDRRQGERIVSLLAIRPVEGGIELVFSDDATIRLDTAAIAVRLQDVGEPWPTPWQPHHDGV